MKNLIPFPFVFPTSMEYLPEFLFPNRKKKLYSNRVYDELTRSYISKEIELSDTPKERIRERIFITCLHEIKDIIYQQPSL